MNWNFFSKIFRRRSSWRVRLVEQHDSLLESPLPVFVGFVTRKGSSFVWGSSVYVPAEIANYLAVGKSRLFVLLPDKRIIQEHTIHRIYRRQRRTHPGETKIRVTLPLYLDPNKVYHAMYILTRGRDSEKFLSHNLTIIFTEGGKVKNGRKDVRS